MKLSLGDTQFVPPRAGVDPAIAQQACVIAKGVWDPNRVGCTLDLGPTLPSWCSWVPFADSISNECKLPTASDLANYGSYTAYMTGQLTGPQSGLDAESQMVQQNQEQSQQLYESSDCAYQAAANHQTLAQLVGPGLTCMLTDPLNSYGWLLYLGIGIAAYMLLSRSRSR